MPSIRTVPMIAAMLTFACAGTAIADPRDHVVQLFDSVTACSHYGHGCMTAGVRHGIHGLEYSVTKADWTECRGDCEQALREDKIDYWDVVRENEK